MSRKRKIDCPQTGRYCRERLVAPEKFDPRSFRTVTTRDGSRLVIACPKGKWNAEAGRCLVGTRLQTILRPLGHSVCRRACRAKPRVSKRP